MTTDEIMAELVKGGHDINRIIELPAVQKSIKALQAEDVKKIEGLQTELEDSKKKVSELETTNVDLNTKVKTFEETSARGKYHGGLKGEITKAVSGQNTKETDIDRMVSFLVEEGYMPQGETDDARAEHLKARVTNLQTLMSIKGATETPSTNDDDSQKPDESKGVKAVPKDTVRTSLGDIPNPLAALTSAKPETKESDKSDAA